MVDKVHLAGLRLEFLDGPPYWREINLCAAITDEWPWTLRGIACLACFGLAVPIARTQSLARTH